MSESKVSGITPRSSPAATRGPWPDALAPRATGSLGDHDRGIVVITWFVEGTQQLHLLEGLNHLADVLKAIREEQEIDRLTVPIHHKFTLSLAEASALAGISRSRLRTAIKDGTLTAQVIGRGYRVKRTDKEDYVDSL